MKIGFIVGSLREGSYNKKVAQVVQGLFSEDFETGFIDLKDVPFYNQDLDKQGDELEAYTNLRKEIREYDAYIFFTPEYNRSLAPAIKNAIDIGSMDKEGNVWNGKPVAVFSASMGAMGGMASNIALRQAFIYTNMIPMQAPEVYLGRIQTLFDDEGNIAADTRQFLQTAVGTFEDHCKKILG